MGECPGPIHSDFPFLCNNPELLACLTAKPAKVLTTEGNLRDAGWLRTRSSDSQGLHTAFFFPSLEVLRCFQSEVQNF